MVTPLYQRPGSSSSSGLSVRASKRFLTGAFAQAGIPFAEEDALEIVLAATGLDKTALILRGTELLTPESSMIIDAYMARRLLGEPVDHILGWREFYGRHFQISAAVLSPRADTETLIRGALQRLDQTADSQLLDLGTGSGAIGLTMLAEAPKTSVIATDLSEAALSIAQANAEALNLQTRVSLRHGGWWDAVPTELVFDMILSNPPYITNAAMETLDREVLDYDPDMALRGGTDGLDPYRIIIAGARAHLTPKGWLGLEIGFDQAQAVEILLESGSWSNIHVDKDLGGMDRVVWAQNSAED